MIVYDKEQKEIVIPNGIGNINLFNNGVEAGYNQGKIDGIEEQKSKLESINITENGTYTKEDGYNHIEVNVPDLNGSYDEGYAEGERVGYAQGKTDGVNEQKSKLESINITENGTYTKEDGYNHIEVNVPDLNGSYNEGYEQGKIDGIDEQKGKLESINISENGTYRKEDGYNEVVVNVPDLNGDYNEGYKQGQADIVAKARVLNVTENGVYKSKYSDPIIPDTYTVTGVYADGTNFYNYAELSSKVFNTKIAGSLDSRLEFWYKGDNASAGFGNNIIIGAGNNDDYGCFKVNYHIGYNSWVRISVGTSEIDISDWDDTVWHHLIISKAEGLWVDGEKKGDFVAYNTVNGEFFINGIGYDTARNANGTFGMIKIDDVIIIPTADGFLNTNTGELLKVVKDGGYNFTENLPTYPEGGGELYKTVNVNIDVDSYYNNGYNQGKTDGANEQKSKLESISITENGTYSKEDGYNNIVVNVPDLNGSYDEGYNQGHTEGYNEGKTDGINEQKGKLTQITISENGTYANENGYSEVVVNVPDLNGSYDEGYTQGQADAVANAKALEVTENGQYGDGKTLYKTINVNVNAVPKINVKEAGINFAYSTFTEVPEWADFKDVTDMSYMFYNCYNLQTISLIDASKVTNMNRTFSNCPSLQTISMIDTSNVTDMSYMFYGSHNLRIMPQIDTSNVTNMNFMLYNYGGMENLVSLPKFNCQKVTNMRNYFSSIDMSALTDVGGWENLKCNWNDGKGLNRLPNLTYQSCINVLNGLYDFSGNGETPNSDQGKLKVAQSFIDKVGDEISIGINKGWAISV